MTISTRGRYGLRAMLVLALRHDSGPVTAHAIARDQGFSLKYLESLLGTLKRAGLIAATRGKTGGYTLARPPARISLYDILTPLEDSLGLVACTNDNACCLRIETCVTREVWRKLKEVTEHHLRRTTLDDLRRRQLRLWRSRGQAGGTARRPIEAPIEPSEDRRRRTRSTTRRRPAPIAS